MIRADTPAGRPGAGEDRLGRADAGAEPRPATGQPVLENGLRLADAPAVAAWQPASATARMASAAAGHRPYRKVPSQRDPECLIRSPPAQWLPQQVAGRKARVSGRQVSWQVAASWGVAPEGGHEARCHLAGSRW